MKKIALFAFNGELMCFAHALLNVLDLKEKGHDVLLIIEGAAVKLIPEFSKKETPFFEKFQTCMEQNLIDCVCKACATKLGTLAAAEQMGLPIKGDMLGHPSFESYIKQGYEIISL